MPAIRLSLPSEPLPEALLESPGFLLTWLADRLTRLYVRGLGEFGLRPPHHGVLVTLADRQPIRQARLEERLRVDHSTFVAAVGDLERRGMLRREADAADRRTLLLELTNQGRAFLDDVEDAMREIEAREFVALTQPERQRMVRSLGKVVSDLAGRPLGESAMIDPTPSL